jgi:N-acetylglucosamine-6-phosphate deacetylase
MERIKIYNGSILTPYRIIENGTVLIEDGKISLVTTGDVSSEGCISINAKGNYVSPGFIDIHTHGGGGHDFMDGTVESYLDAARLHAVHGTASMVPTTLASELEELKNTFQVFKQAKAMNKNGAEFLGIHLEGPYFSMEARGAQDPKYIKNPNPEEYKKILEWSDDIVRWSAAPELDGAMEFGRFMKANGILVSIAHTDAISDCVYEAYENGFTHITHLYSCTSNVRRINAYRYAGVTESAYLIDEMTVEIIADGCHLPKSLLQLVYKIKGADKIALVTDSMRGAGMTEGETILGSLDSGQRVIIEDGVAKLPDRSAFAGSIATTDRLVRTMVKTAEIPLLDAVKMMTATPARIIGVDNKKGILAPGKDADIVIFNSDIEIMATLVNGRIVYQI